MTKSDEQLRIEELETALRDVYRVIFFEMPGMSLDGMGEKYYNKVRQIVDRTLTPKDKR
jgi:hypothetical protein